jgi:hypothetical protein
VRAPRSGHFDYDGRFTKGIPMKTLFAMLLACLCLGACKDKHEPLKPTVSQPAVQAPAPAV